MVGITIGASFMVALVAGPIAAGFIGVAGIFWLMVALGACRHRNHRIRGAEPAPPCACIATPKRCRR